MTGQELRRVLVYKRTHEGDPDPETGVFGNDDCMGKVRRWEYDAVIGVGGVRPWIEFHEIAKKLTWVGIGPLKRDRSGSRRGPQVTFDHFRYWGSEGPLLEGVAWALARRLFEKHARALLVTPSSAEWTEVKRLLNRAKSAPPSGKRASMYRRTVRKETDGCRRGSCYRR